MATPAITSIVDRHTPTDGSFETGIDGLQLFRLSHPVERTAGIYPPSACVIVQGSKTAYFSGGVHVYDSHHYFCNTVSLPVEAEVKAASPNEPVLGFMLDLSTRAARETIVSHAASGGGREARAATADSLSSVTTWDQDFTVAVERLLELLDRPAAISMLGEGRYRELVYAMLTGPAGPMISAVNGSNADIAIAVDHIAANLDAPISIDDLARETGMSRAAFDRRFKSATSHSPLQYIKAIRLNHAARLIANGEPITRAAADVGYTSPSQFSREFKRQFGASPRAWAHTAIDPGLDAQAAS